MLPRGADRGELISPLTCVPGAEVVGLGPPSITPLNVVVCLIQFLSRIASRVVIAVSCASSVV